MEGEDTDTPCPQRFLLTVAVYPLLSAFNIRPSALKSWTHPARPCTWCNGLLFQGHRYLLGGTWALVVLRGHLASLSVCRKLCGASSYAGYSFERVIMEIIDVVSKHSSLKLIYDVREKSRGTSC